MAKQRRKVTRKRNKKKTNIWLRLWTVVLVVIAVISFFVKDIPVDYYKDLDGAKGANLKTSIHELIREHQYLSFDENTTARYWWNNYFDKTDWHPDGHYWDMYSNEKHSKYMGGTIQNREHCMPRSRWGKRDKYSSYDANGDLHNIFPSDYAANSAKSNLPLGEVGIAKFDNGISKVGSNTYPNGYKGQVFEPANEYKGDFARVFFYMVTCYQDYSYDWKAEALKSMLQAGAYPGFQPWAIEMLMKWHRNDPVSEKEIDRNTEVYRIQNNRNPFVDNPDLAEYIWGSKVDEPFYLQKTAEASNQPYLKDIVYRYMYKFSQFINNTITKFR